MGKFILAAVAITLLIYALFDLVATPKTQIRGPIKPLWFVAILVPIIGPTLWLSYGHKRNWRPSNPRAGRPRPYRPNGPDDDPDYLNGL